MTATHLKFNTEAEAQAYYLKHRNDLRNCSTPWQDESGQWRVTRLNWGETPDQ